MAESEQVNHNEQVEGTKFKKKNNNNCKDSNHNLSPLRTVWASPIRPKQ